MFLSRFKIELKKPSPTSLDLGVFSFFVLYFIISHSLLVSVLMFKWLVHDCIGFEPFEL